MGKHTILLPGEGRRLGLVADGHAITADPTGIQESANECLVGGTLLTKWNYAFPALPTAFSTPEVGTRGIGT